MPNAPLILTLMLDANSQFFFNTLRKQHFPPERNYLDAHLTLFHHLPANEPQLIEDIAIASQNYTAMQLNVTEIKSIGNGVAYKIKCDKLLNLHQKMQQQWAKWLIPQDRQKLWPHITIQNKVEPNLAKSLKEELEQSFEPFTATGTGLSLYEYVGGPWNFIHNYKFAH
ncbi:2'-5' RNA ligase family protein [Mucilaginibacter terrae]|uniref:2'-5' RNA ligase family protein n=1 Tax=Mucilaginibacter terrae TaxID=1955052 RepID=UPI00363A186E